MARKPTRMAAEWSESGKLQRVILELLDTHAAADELPTSARFLFYELEQRGQVAKTEKGQKPYAKAGEVPRIGNMHKALMHLRLCGEVPWSWISDETRAVHVFLHAPSVAEYVKGSTERARINPWPGEPPLLIVESRSLGGVLYELASEYVVPIAPTNGQAGGFLRTDVVPLLDGNDRAVLYLGDWDLAGAQIEANTRRVLEEETGREFVDGVNWTRIAITEAQIEARKLKPIWKTDDRYDPPRQHYAWEAEALGQGTIVSLVREALGALLPQPLKVSQEKEKRQRKQVAAALDALPKPRTPRKRS